MKWVSKAKDIEVSLPDTVSPGIWCPVRVRSEAWEICWEPLLRTVFARKGGTALEVPLKYRALTSKRFPGDMFAEVLLEYTGGPLSQTQSLAAELAVHVPGLEGRTQAAGAQGEAIRSPMVGKVLKVHVAIGQMIERGQELLVIEAMKMENKIFAKSGGRVTELQVQAGHQVSVGQMLIQMRAE